MYINDVIFRVQNDPRLREDIRNSRTSAEKKNQLNKAGLKISSTKLNEINDLAKKTIALVTTLDFADCDANCSWK